MLYLLNKFKLAHSLLLWILEPLHIPIYVFVRVTIGNNYKNLLMFYFGKTPTESEKIT